MVAAQPIPELPAVFLPEEKSWGGGLLTSLGTALDSTILRAMQTVVNATLMPAPEDLPAMRASAQVVLDPELQRNPARYFEFPESTMKLESVAERVRRNLPGGRQWAREFVGHYTAYAEDAQEDRVDDRILLDHWMHEPERRRATILALHGFTMGQPRVDSVALFASHWYRNGLDVALLTLPYHGARTPRGARFSGEHFAVPHVARLAEAVRRGVYEIRLLTTWLQKTSGAPVGILGLSLGGYLGALTAGLFDDLDFVIPMVPPVCIGDLAHRFFQKSRYARAGEAERSPAFSYDELRASYRVHSPLAHPLRMPRERVFIVAGRGDRIVPPEHPYALWLHWGEPAIHWYSGSHVAPFGRREIVRAVLRHLRALHIL